METENQQLSGSLNNSTVIASEQSERGNLHTTENGRLNQEIATPATQVRNDGLNSGCLKHLFKAVITKSRRSLRSLTKSNCSNPLNVSVTQNKGVQFKWKDCHALTLLTLAMTE